MIGNPVYLAVMRADSYKIYPGLNCRGYALLMLAPAVIFMLIVGWALISRTSSEFRLIYHTHHGVVSAYLSEGAIEIAHQYVKTRLNLPESSGGYLESFKSDKGFGPLDMLSVGDVKTLINKLESLTPEGEGRIQRLSIEFRDVQKFSDSNNEHSGTLEFVAQASFAGNTRVLHITRDIKVVDVQPPAPEYSLFVNQEQPYDRRFEISEGGVMDIRNGAGISRGKIRLSGRHDVRLGTGEMLGSFPVSLPENPATSEIAAHPKDLIPVQAMLKLPFSDQPGGKCYGGSNGSILSQARLFGYYSQVNHKLIQPPSVLEGEVFKHYKVYTYTIPIPFPPPPSTPVTTLYLPIRTGSDSSPYNYNSPNQSDAPEIISKPPPYTGPWIKNFHDYKRRSVFYARDLNPDRFYNLLERVTELEGIFSADNFEFRVPQGQELKYRGKSLFNISSQMTIGGKFYRDDRESFTTFVFNPALPGVVQPETSEKDTMMDVNFYARDGVRVPVNTWYMRINGNLVVESLNKQHSRGRYRIQFENPTRGKDTIVVSMSPHISGYFERGEVVTP